MASKIKLVQNDQLPDIQLTLTDKNNNNTPINLSGNYTVMVHWRPLGATTSTDELSCTITDAANGIVTMHFNTTTLSNPGEYEGEIEITYPDGRPRTVYDTLKFTVRGQIG